VVKICELLNFSVFNDIILLIREDGMLKRKIFSELVDWKQREDRLCLLVKGARQVGKTFIINEFARTQYHRCVVLNFDENPGYKTIFDGDLDVETLIKQISLRVPHADLVPGDTLLFFDENPELS